MYLLFNTIKLFYNRYLRTYKLEINEYLRQKGYKYVETFSAKKKDWSRSPIKMPSQYELGPFTRGVQWTKYEYLIIVGERNQKYHEFWLEIKTSYFQKSKLIFSDGQRINYIDNKNSELVIENCPNCGYMLFSNDDINCPDCGFKLK
jgi:DNA-directed RNA polymerase subunit RPC12/RpoP